MSIPNATSANMGSDLKTVSSTPSSPAAAAAPKPCCVCKDEKAARDECMLFSNAADPQKDCIGMIDQYKSCMAGFGFKLP